MAVRWQLRAIGHAAPSSFLILDAFTTCIDYVNYEYLIALAIPKLLNILYYGGLLKSEK